MIDEWIEYFEFHPEDEWGRKLIDKCGYEEKMNAVHVAVIRNRVQILTKLAKAGAGMEMHNAINIIICTIMSKVNNYKI